MNIYVFSSINLTNIWAGIGAKKWGISENQANSPGTKTKSQSVKIGSLGLLYCSDPQLQVFTTPFVITSAPDDAAVVANIWPEKWWFPFGIEPLGSPLKVLHKDQVQREMPSLLTGGSQWNRTLYVQPNFVFQTSTVSDHDWEYLYTHLQR